MKKYTPKESRSFSVGNSLLSFKEGEIYNDSEIIRAYKRFFNEVEVPEETITEDLVPLEEVKAEELLFDNSSDVQISILDKIKENTSKLFKGE
jgi:hypothetical protein